MKGLKATISDTAAEVGTVLLPAVTPMVTKFSEVVLALSKWLNKNRELIPIVGATGVALVALGPILGGLGSITTALAGTIGLLGTAVAGVFTVAGSPFLLAAVTTAALAVAIDELGAFATNGESTISRLGSVVGVLADDFKTAFSGISDSLATGDFKSSLEIMALTVELVFARIKATVEGTVGAAKIGLIELTALLDKAAVLTSPLASTLSGRGFEEIDADRAQALADVGQDLVAPSIRVAELQLQLQRATESAQKNRASSEFFEQAQTRIEPVSQVVQGAARGGLPGLAQIGLALTSEEGRELLTEIKELNRKTGLSRNVRF